MPICVILISVVVVVVVADAVGIDNRERASPFAIHTSMERTL
jgi:hypothetical protein